MNKLFLKVSPALQALLDTPPPTRKVKATTAAVEAFGVSWPAILSQEIGQRWDLLITQKEVGKATGDAGAKMQAVGNPYPHSIFIRSIDVWNGLGLDDVVDMWTRAWLCGGIYQPPMPVWSHCKDRYMRTSENPPFNKPLGDTYYELVEGGWITVAAQAGTVSGTPFGYQTQFTFGFEVHRPVRNVQIVHYTADALEVQGLKAEKANLEMQLSTVRADVEQARALLER